MKQIFMSIHSQPLFNILNGDKIRELRKSVPSGFVGWVYLYCTKAKPTLHRLMVECGNEWYLGNDLPYGWVVNKNSNFNGKVVARFWFDDYDVFVNWDLYSYYADIDYGKIHKQTFNKLEKDACLTIMEIYNYSKGKDLYAWYIKNLQIFDKPMELSEFYDCNKEMTLEDILVYELITNDTKSYRLSKAPQSWQYVWVKE